MRFLMTLFASVILLSCSTGPEPLNYGKDACANCRMILMDKKFGAEFITAKGKVYKFDDVNCMIQHMRSDALADQGIRQILVADFANPGTLIEAEGAFFLKSASIKSPMGSMVGAFNIEQERSSYREEVTGDELSWTDIKLLYQ